jgi:hypothetical protein
VCLKEGVCRKYSADDIDSLMPIRLLVLRSVVVQELMTRSCCPPEAFIGYTGLLNSQSVFRHSIDHYISDFE